MICLVGLLTNSAGGNLGADPDDMHWPTQPPAAVTTLAADAGPHGLIGNGTDC